MEATTTLYNEKWEQIKSIDISSYVHSSSGAYRTLADLDQKTVFVYTSGDIFEKMDEVALIVNDYMIFYLKGSHICALEDCGIERLDESLGDIANAEWIGHWINRRCNIKRPYLWPAEYMTFDFALDPPIRISSEYPDEWRSNK